MDWLQIVLVRYATSTLSPQLTADPTAPLADAVLLKHCHAVLIRELPGIDHSLSRATGFLIATNIGDLV